MNLRLLASALIILLLGGCEQQQQTATGFNRYGLNQDTLPDYPFAEVTKDYQLQFPRDHRPHPEYRIEWWYITANLEDAEGKHYALQWTLFRTALPQLEANGDIRLQQYYLAHVAIGNRQQHFAAEKYGRGDMGNAGIELNPFTAFIDHWQASSEQADALFPMRISFTEPGFSADLRLTNHGPIMLQGENGYSAKSPDASNASHYYSMPWLQVTGHIQLGEAHTKITADVTKAKVTGQAWFDREWSSALLAPNQQGWDWLALHLDDGSALMLYQLRSKAGAPFRFAGWMAKSGETRAFSQQAIEMVPLAYSKIAGRRIPTSWQIQLPEMALDITVTPLNPAQYMQLSQPYWEGAVFIQGSHSGRGFLEMTGY